MASAASSCASGALEPSHVLAAMGVPRALAGGSLRLSLGVTTTDADVDRALEVMPAAVARLAVAGLVRVLVAMSGGVDSSVAAALLRDAGHDVVGVTMKLWGGESDTGCCSVSDVDDARRVARAARHRAPRLQLRRRLHAPTSSGPTSPRTPPATRRTRASSATAISSSTGSCGGPRGSASTRSPPATTPASSYATTASRRVARGADAGKDQSYVLHMLGQEQLAATLLPVGELTKADVRAIADDLGLRTATKPDSQDVCFITSSSGRSGFLRERLTFTPAAVVDRAGHRVGQVDAIELVTVGQRKGLGLQGGDEEARYAVEVDAAARHGDRRR